MKTVDTKLPQKQVHTLQQRLEQILNSPGKSLSSLVVVAFAYGEMIYEGYDDSNRGGLEALTNVCGASPASS